MSHSTVDQDDKECVTFYYRPKL